VGIGIFCRLNHRCTFRVYRYSGCDCGRRQDPVLHLSSDFHRAAGSRIGSFSKILTDSCLSQSRDVFEHDLQRRIGVGRSTERYSLGRRHPHDAGSIRWST
jgi:hypothetical protein